MIRQRLTSSELDRLRAAYPTQAELESTAGVDAGIMRLLPPGLSTLASPVVYQPGEVVFYDQEPGDAMYAIRAGRVAVIRGTFDNPIILGFRSAGEFVGEMALIEDLPRSATVVALDELHLLRVAREDFQALLAEIPSLDQNLLRRLSARLRAADDERTAIVARMHALEVERQRLIDQQRHQQAALDLIIHDLRSPLHILTNALGILDMGLPESIRNDNRELFDLTMNTLDRMSRLVDSLLDVSRLEAGQLSLEMEPTDLMALIRSVADRVSYLIAKHELSLEVDGPTTPVHALIDADLIDRVVANLLDNAIKFTLNKGRIRAHITPRAADILVSVEDTGPGIPLDQRERFFDRFVQGTDRPGRTQGFGLGLAFCRMAVQAHGGHIWIEDAADGLGARFTFNVPRAQPGDLRP